MAMTMATMTMRNAKMIVPTDRDIGRQVVHTFNAAYSGKKTQCATLMSFSANAAVIKKVGDRKPFPSRNSNGVNLVQRLVRHSMTFNARWF